MTADVVAAVAHVEECAACRVWVAAALANEEGNI